MGSLGTQAHSASRSLVYWCGGIPTRETEQFDSDHAINYYTYSSTSFSKLGWPCPLLMRAICEYAHARLYMYLNIIQQQHVVSVHS